MQIKLVVGGGGGGVGSFELVTKSECQVQFKSRAVVLSHGGKQELHPEFFKWFPTMS